MKPFDYIYGNRETIYVPEDEKIIDEEEDIMASAPNPRAEKNSIAIELFGKPLFQLTPMEMEQLENFLQEKATKLAMGGIVSLAGGGSAGYPPIEVGIINTPDQNLNIGLSQNLNPFASYTRNFDMFGGQGGGGQGYGGPELNSLYGGGTPISQLPNSTTSTQQLPDYNAMYNKSDQNPLIGASTPGDGMIMAANEVLGGSAFGSNF